MDALIFCTSEIHLIYMDQYGRFVITLNFNDTVIKLGTHYY